MNRILLGIIAFFLCFPVFSGRIVLNKNDIHFKSPQVNIVELFRKIPKAKSGVAPLSESKAERRVMVLRVEFVEDDDPRTTGNGKMDYEGNGEDPIIDIVEGDTLLNPYYDGPHTKKYFEMLMECLKNFYLVNSYGNCRVQYRVFPDGDSAAYQLPHTMLYYGYPDEMEPGLCTLVRDAIMSAEEQDTTGEFSSWRAMSTDLMIFHAGSCWQTDIMWDSPYDLASSFIPAAACEYYLGDYSFLGYNWEGATVLPEMARQDGVMFGLEGQVVHEYAHNLGHFDLYDVSGRSMGVGSWDLMGYGGWLGDPLLPAGKVPSMHSAFFKCWKKWVKPLVVQDDTTVWVYQAEMDTTEFGEAPNEVLVVKVPINENEYFLVENRQEFAYSDTLYANMEMGVIIYVEGGQWDYFLPGSGLLIWHIDEGVIDENLSHNTVNAEASRKGVDLEEADGIQDFDEWVEGSTYEIYGSPYDPFFSPHNDSFAPGTNPNTSDNDGGATGIHMIEIGGSGKTIRLKVLRGGGERFRPREGFPVSLGDTFGFGTNSVNIWEKGEDFGVVTAGRGGNLYVVGDSVTTLTTDTSVWSSPLVYDDSVIMAVTLDGEFHSWRLDGSEYWPTFRVGQGPFRSSPAAGDIDGDGVKEIIVGSDDMWLYFIDNGAVANKVFLGDVIRTSAAFADLDGNGGDEVIVSSGDSRLFVFTGDGNALSGYPVITEVLGPLEASPVVGDLDSDGELELVALSMEGDIHCFDASGHCESYWPSVVGKPAFASPALGDIDRDGYLEIVMISGKNLYAMNHNGTICTGFPVELSEPTPLPWYWFDEDSVGEFGGFEELTSSPILLDFEGDGYLEILFGSGTNVYGYDYRGDELDGFPLGCGGGVSSTPAAIVRGDTLFLFAASDEGMVYCWEMTGTPVSVWPMFRKDATHSGFYRESLVEPVFAAGLLRNVYNYPNPVYGARTTLRYYLAEDATVKIKIFDVAGEIVGEYDGHTTVNEHNEVVLDLSGLASGLYVYRIEAKNSARSEEVTKKLAIVR